METHAFKPIDASKEIFKENWGTVIPPWFYKSLPQCNITVLDPSLSLTTCGIDFLLVALAGIPVVAVLR